jgi:hypothetical protein
MADLGIAIITANTDLWVGLRGRILRLQFHRHRLLTGQQLEIGSKSETLRLKVMVRLSFTLPIGNII